MVPLEAIVPHVCWHCGLRDGLLVQRLEEEGRVGPVIDATFLQGAIRVS